MGMAASQARYLALVARKSNCEYQGQQINQQRLTLSNQSANLFNQMLGLTVPVPPSTSDYTKLQYSYSDGTNASTISSWQQLGTADPNFNYVVTHYYYTDKYTGSLKKLSDPKVQFGNDPNKTTSETARDARDALDAVYKAAATYKADLADLEVKKAALDSATTVYDAAKSKAGNRNTYAETYSKVTSTTETGGVYTVTNDGKTYTFSKYSDNTEVKNQIDTLIKNGAITAEEAGTVTSSQTDYSNIYVYKDTDGNYQFAFKKDLDSCKAKTSTTLTAYDIGKYDSTSKKWSGDVVDDDNALKTAKADYEAAKTAYTTAETQTTTDKLAYDSAVLEYESKYNSPSYVGNCELTRLDILTDDQQSELEQVCKDMEAQGISCNMLEKCFSKNADGTYTYKGGAYSFTMNGTTYYTTLEDLYDSYKSGEGNNYIDGQQKLTYYNASYINTKVETTEKALMATDGNGRFTSIRFENDSVTYTLNAETVTDENAYNDAMNQYNYENAVYDKTVQDINAKTSIIQQEDQELELRLKQLDTEQNALKTEMEAVQKVVKDNVDDTFKTFNH